MIQIIKTNDQPLTFKIGIKERLEATYLIDNVVFEPNISANSAEIVLNLVIDSNAPSLFEYSFSQPFVGFEANENIVITIKMKNKDGQDIVHQESATHLDKPLQESKVG